MRPIKFRCWNSKKMWYPETLSVDGNPTSLHFFNDGISIGWGLYDNVMGNRIVSGEYGEIMQFTGLRDKDGKEIYESDIIQWGHLPDSYEHEIRIALVKINPDIQFDCNNISFPHVFRWGKFAYSGNKLEVIGNIYEHKHLLKTKV